jgi:ubiquinone biosynthesis protein UbiJ
MLIKALLSGAFENVLNHYLALDKNTPLTLAPLAGKVIAITVKPFNETLYFCPTDHSIQCLETFVGEVDATLTGYLSAFGLLGFPNLPLPDSASDTIEITGDLTIGMQFQQIFRQLNVNVEEKLASVVGADFANTLSNLFYAGREWQQETVETFKVNASEFLQEETRDLPAKAETVLFYQRIALLNQELNALEKRLKPLAISFSNKDRSL